MLEIEVLKGGIEIITNLTSEWSNVCEENASNVPFFRPEWFKALLKSFRDKIELVTVRKDGQLRALLPLVRKRDKLHGLPVRKLQAVFNPNTPRFDIIHSPDQRARTEIMEAMWTELKFSRGWDVFECRLVRNDSWLRDLLATAKKDRFPTGVWPMGTAPYIKVPEPDINGSIDHFFAGKRKHLSKELSRRLRRLKESGTVEFITTYEFSTEIIDRYLELENKGWKGRKGTAAILDSKAIGLHLDFCRSLAEKKDLLVYELRLDGKTIAMSINIVSGDEVFHWKTTYDEGFSRFSPGNLLFMELLTDCAGRGIREIDFMCPSVPYKKVWATGERDHVGLYIFRPAWAGWISWAWKFIIISRLRELKNAYPKMLEQVGSRPV